jgi:hypothetical protein
MFRVNAFTHKGTKFRFRIQGEDIHAVRATLKTIFEGKAMRLVLVEPIC